MKREFDAYKLSRCMCPSSYNRLWDRGRYGRKSSFFHIPLHSTPPLRGFPSEHRHPVWWRKTGMVWLPDGKKISNISLFILAQLTNVTDRRTDRHRMPAIAALTCMHSIARQYKKLSYRWQTMRCWFVKLLNYGRTFCQNTWTRSSRTYATDG